MALTRKHGHCVMEDVTAALDALVQPAGAMSLLVDGDRVSLTATVIDGINESDVELVWVCCEMVRA